MKPLSHHLHTVRQKPPHVRKQVAFALSAGATALIALVWLVGSLLAGSWHIADTSFADAGRSPIAAGSANTGSQTLIGAAAAAFVGSSTPAHLEVVGADSQQATGGGQQEGDQTIIPF